VWHCVCVSSTLMQHPILHQRVRTPNHHVVMSVLWRKWPRFILQSNTPILSHISYLWTVREVKESLHLQETYYFSYAYRVRSILLMPCCLSLFLKIISTHLTSDNHILYWHNFVTWTSQSTWNTHMESHISSRIHWMRILRIRMRTLRIHMRIQ